MIYYTFNKSHLNSFILLVFIHVANLRYVANFRFLTLHHVVDNKMNILDANQKKATMQYSCNGKCIGPYKPCEFDSLVSPVSPQLCVSCASP